MKITRVQKEPGVSLLKVVVGESDYGEAVEKMLHSYKRKANIPGFRPGMVPMGIIKKMYGKGAVAEQSYRTASEAAFDYLQKEKIDYVGDVIPAEEQGDFDFDNSTEFEFVFEVGEAPKYDVTLSDKDKIEYNRIKIDKKMHESFLENFLRRYGRLVDVDEVSGDEALTVTLDNGDLRVEDAYVGLISMGEEERKPFHGKKVGDKMDIDIDQMYKNPAQRAAMLHVKEEELKDINPKFSMEITKIRRFANPEINDEFFKTAFPDGSVKSAAELDTYIDSLIDRETLRESDFMFIARTRDYMLKRAALQMPEGFLKRWLYTINEGKFSMEEIEKDFDSFLKMFTWNYIQRHIIDAEKITVSKEEAEAEARDLAAVQFAQYGMPDAPEDMLARFAKNILDDKEQNRRIYEKLYEQKVVDSIKSKVKVVEKSVSAEEFAKLAQSL